MGVDAGGYGGWIPLITFFLDSERSDNCIDFKIMSVFFYVITFWGSKNDSIFYLLVSESSWYFGEKLTKV